MLSLKQALSSNRLAFFGLVVAACFGWGCASTNVNPKAPRANTGYVDCFADSSEELCWDVRVFDPSTQQFKKRFSTLRAPEDGIVRLAFRPGQYQLRITFLNRVTAQPALVEAEVLDGMVTPVRVELAEAGMATVETKQTSVGGTFHGGYGRRTKIGSQQTASFRVTASPQPPQPYQPRQQMPYSHRQPQ